MSIRQARHSDIPAILEISNWAAAHTPANFAIEPEQLDDWLQSWERTRDMYPWLVAEQADTPARPVIGFAKASPHRGRCAYAWTAEVSVYVLPDHHGKGVGGALYSRLIPILKSQGYATLIAGITTPNLASEHLHASFGFQRIGAFQRVGWKFGQWYDVGYWELPLLDGSEPPGGIRPVADVLAIESGRPG